MSTQPESATTFLDALVTALQRAGAYNKHDQAPPAAVLWTDKDRQWLPLAPLLRDRLPLLTLGAYAPDELTGPAYWLRCVIAGTLPEPQLPADATPIIYLPGVSRQELRAVEECPKALQPLVELQYRGLIWSQANNRDWSAAAFLQSQSGGLGIEVGSDSATREALERALLKLAGEPVALLRQRAPLRASFFNELLNPDEVRSLLLWLDDPQGFPKRLSEAEWGAFRDSCRRKYSFDPLTDGPLTAAERLGKRGGVWDNVWRRFAEAPTVYRGIPGKLRDARPHQAPSLLVEYEPGWPQDNQAAEQALRQYLGEAATMMPAQARAEIRALEEQHGIRRSWVWSVLGEAPLAAALRHLAALADCTERALGGTQTAEIAAAYAEWGWQTDAAMLDALASVSDAADVAAVRGAVLALYRPWLEAAARAFQDSVAAGSGKAAYPLEPPAAPKAGTCILFSDALRFDVGKRLAQALDEHGFPTTLDPRLTALPSVTGTAKPAVSPVANLIIAGTGLGTRVATTGTQLNAESLRNLLRDAGYQVLRGEELGEPSGRGWTEMGAIDSSGHQHGWKLAQHLQAEVRELAQRIAALLDWGWQQVVVVTDHGWLLLPGGLPKAELPEHLTEVRKGRCARLKASASTTQQTVPWYWDHDVRIAVAPGIACYEAGKEYEHGGLSPQECVVPLLRVARPKSTAGAGVTLSDITWKGMRCVVRVGGEVAGLLLDIRGKANNPSTSLAAAPKAIDANGTGAVLVPDEDRAGEAALLVVVAADGTIRAQALTTIGG